MAKASEQDFDKLEKLLCGADVPLARRFRALFTLRSVGNAMAIDIIGRGFHHNGALVGHELAYCLGQIKDVYALPILEGVLRDIEQHPMVRHEAAEAMGAIGDRQSLPVLEEYLNKEDENISVKETCEIAIATIRHDNGMLQDTDGDAQQASMYDSIDPAPPLSIHGTTTPENPDIDAIRKLFLDENATLFQRYRAMFSLRNIGSEQAVLALAEGLEDSSALFRHEVAYVFGQLSSPYSVPALLKSLTNDKEDEMVRHEAAEALGSIASPDVMPVLQKYATQGPRVVRESCQVALDMVEYETSGEFQYAEPLGSA